jgi:hypothetical protein
MLSSHILSTFHEKNLVRIRNPTYEEGIVKVSGAEEDLNADNSFTLKLARTLSSATFALFDTNLVALADPNFARRARSVRSQRSVRAQAPRRC